MKEKSSTSGFLKAPSNSIEGEKQKVVNLLATIIVNSTIKKANEKGNKILKV